LSFSEPARSFLSSILSAKFLLPNLMAATLISVMKITTAISIGALIFSGPLSPYLSTGIGLFLLGTAVGGALVAAGSGFRAVVSGPRSAQAPILAGMAAAIALAMEGQSDEAIAVTVVVSILATTIIVGIFLFALGWIKMGALVRFIPYPVMGGFFAGLGFLLIKGGIAVVLGPIGDFADPGSFFTSNAILHLAPAVCFAVLFYIAQQRIRHWLLMPIFLGASLFLFYATLFATGTSVETATAENWLPSFNLGAEAFFPIITIDQLALVDWGVIVTQSSTILVMVLMSIIMLLLDTSGIEIALNRDMDPNHELKAAGVANIFTGFASGPLVIQSAVDTAFTHRLGGTRYVMILAHSLIIFAVIYAGPAPIAYLPTTILGGLLIFIGIDFLMKWVWDTRKKLPLTDFTVICGILLVVATYGILEGVAVGIALALLLFVHSYSQLSVIKSSLSGTEHVSNVDRNFKEREYLEQHGDALHIFVLQGFLFFGTASRLLDDIRTLLDNRDRVKIKYLVLDFHQVDALDTSAANSFAKLSQICTKDSIELVFTGCSIEISQRLKSLNSDATTPAGNVRIFNYLNEGVTWCEDAILQGYESEDNKIEPEDLLAELLQNSKAAKTLAPYFKQTSYDDGHTLFRQGDPGEALYLILQGSVSIVVELADGDPLHLRTIRAGAILGEMALYSGTSRSATAVVNGDSILFQLDQKSYRKINKNWPAEFGLFHAFIVRLMSERLSRANKEIMALSR